MNNSASAARLAVTFIINGDGISAFELTEFESLLALNSVESKSNSCYDETNQGYYDYDDDGEGEFIIANGRPVLKKTA